jgi:subtilisin family serine protease/GH25 family lysozyme M1 (1,4-beta-N-acetylmuramidase)/fibronectin type 3 domain-containing protein
MYAETIDVTSASEEESEPISHVAESEPSASELADLPLVDSATSVIDLETDAVVPVAEIEPDSSALDQTNPATAEEDALPVISSALRNEKRRAATIVKKLDKLVSGKDYSNQDLLVAASSRVHANEIAAAYDATVKQFSNKGYAILRLNTGHSVKDAIAIGASESNSLPPVYPDWINQIDSSIPNDALLDQQYFHSLIDSMAAWTQTTGSLDTTVAVIDTGIDINHPEFISRVSTRSYNAYTNLVGIDKISDDIGHGTHVAGIIAANQNNDIGVSGIAPGVSLLIVKANKTGTGSFVLSDLIESIYYAVDNGADVINLSLGRPYDVGPNVLEQQAIQYAFDRGVTVVAAAGNESDDHAGYPAAYPQVIAVSAANSNAAFDTTYSNFGPEVDICAPGTAVLSTYLNSQYAYMTGTSMASPVVAGAVALLKSAKPEMTPDEISNRLYQAAVDLGPSGFDNQYGNGLLNLSSALATSESAESGYWGDYSYQVISGEIELTGYTGNQAVIDVPATIEGLPVASIASSVFSNLDDAKYIRFPKTLRNIGEDNFSNSSLLKAVSFSGDAPAVDGTCFTNNPDFEKIYYLSGATGFASIWQGWPAESFEGDFSVNFRNWDGTVLSTQKVQIFDPALTPQVPTRYKYTFIEWDHPYSHVTSDLDIVAQFEDRPDPAVARPATEEASILMSPTSAADIKAIDVSQWNGPIDFSKVKTAASTVYIRAASFKFVDTGWQFYQDTAMATHAANAKANGMNFGFYIYYRPQATPALSVSYAQQFYAIIKNYNYNCVPVIDVETTNGLTKTQITASVKAFADELKRLTGVNPMVYSYVYFANTYLGTDLSPFKLWIAHWGVSEPAQTTTWPKWDMWQYSSTGTVPGISGDVDLNKATRNIFAMDLTAKVTGSDTVSLSWPGIPIASHYEIYRSTSLTGTYSLIGTTASTQFQASQLVPGTPYYFKVVMMASGVPRIASPVATAKPISLLVTGLKAASAGYDQVKLTWSALSGAAGYVVYRQDAGAWQEIGRTTAPVVSFTDTGRTTGTAYTYAVKGVSSTGVVGADYSASASATPIPLTVTGLKAMSGGYDRIELSWTRETPAEIETTYTVYRATVYTGPYTIVGTAMDASYIDAAVVTGRTYYYKVRASVNGAVSVALSAYAAGRALPVAPSDLTGEGGVRQASLSWIAAEGATGYQIYRATSPAGSYSLVGSTGNLSYTNTGLTAGVTYYYKVRSYTRVGTTNIYGTLYSNFVPVTPDLGDVTGLVATAASASSIRLSWPAVANATKYEIFETDADGEEKRLVGSTSYTYWTHSGLVAGEGHHYVVQAVRVSGALTIRSLNDSAVVSSHAGPLKVLGLKAASTGYDQVKLTWSALSGAAGYVVYRQANGEWTEIGRTTAPVVTFTDTGRTTGTAYSYAVKAVSSTGVVGADYSASASATPIPLTVTGLKAMSGGYDRVELNWTRETPAEIETTYTVYRATSTTGTYTLVGTAMDSSYTDATVVTGRTYYYKVRASVNGALSPALSGYVAGRALPVAPSDLTGEGGVRQASLSWTAAEGATGYQVYRATSPTGTYSLVGTTSNLTYVNTGLTAGVTYYYKVRSYTRVGTTNIYGALYSNLVPVTPDLGDVTGLTATAASASSIRLSWPTVANATKYEIFETAADGAIAAGALPKVSTSYTSWTHSGLVAGEEHFYVVRAVRVSGALSIRSLNDSVVVSSHAGPLKVLGLKAASAGYDQVKLTWSALSGAAGYVVYRQDAGAWQEIGRITAPVVTYTDTGRTTGTAYTYAVKGVSSTGVVGADYSASATATPIPLTVNGLKAISDGYDRVKLSWTRETPADVATTYTVYRATSSTGTYTLVGTAMDSSYTDAAVVTGRTYYYKVRASVNGALSPALSGSVAGKALPVAPESLSASAYSINQILLNWSAAEGASGYAIYRATSLNGTYSLIASTSTLEYLNGSLSSTITYFYKIRSYRLVGTTKIYSADYSPIASAKP